MSRHDDVSRRGGRRSGWHRNRWLVVAGIAVLAGSGAVAAAVIVPGAPPLGPNYSRCYGGVPATNPSAARSAALFFVSGRTLAAPGLSATQIQRSDVSWQAQGTAVSDLKVGAATTVASGTGQDSVVWSPSIGRSGTTLAYIQGSALEVGQFGGEGDLVMATADGANHHVIRTFDDTDPVWSPDGKNLAVVDDGTVVILSSTGQSLRVVQGAPDVNTVAWSPNSECIAASSGDSPTRIVIADVHTGAAAWLTPAGTAGYYPAWSPLGNKIVYANSAGALVIADLSDGETRELAGCPAVSCTQQLWPTWSPDGALIAFVRNNETREQIFMVPSTGGTPQQVTFGPDEHVSPTW